MTGLLNRLLDRIVQASVTPCPVRWTDIDRDVAEMRKQIELSRAKWTPEQWAHYREIRAEFNAAVVPPCAEPGLPPWHVYHPNRLGRWLLRVLH